MRCGSHLYGTATPSSDVDVKGVYLPGAAGILLQRVRPTVSVPPARAEGARNAAGRVDAEIFSLDRYLALLAAGQTIALDMLFAPDEALLRPPHDLWTEIRRNAPRFVTRRVGSFLSYARRQAAKFGIKGSRLAAARRALELLRAAEAGRGGQARLGRIEALELLATGRIAFPLACAPHLLAVKRGEVPYAEVAAEIERLAGEVEAAAAASALPDEPDRAFIEGLLFRSYGRRVIDAMTRDVPS
jgi:hypothetical protein